MVTDGTPVLIGDRRVNGASGVSSASKFVFCPQDVYWMGSLCV